MAITMTYYATLSQWGDKNGGFDHPNTTYINVGSTTTVTRAAYQTFPSVAGYGTITNITLYLNRRVNANYDATNSNIDNDRTLYFGVTNITPMWDTRYGDYNTSGYISGGVGEKSISLSGLASSISSYGGSWYLTIYNDTRPTATSFWGLDGNTIPYIVVTYETTVTEVTVTFDPTNQGMYDGAYVYPTSKTVQVGSTYGTLPTPSYTGYTFAGWVDESYNDVTSSTIVTADTDHTQYAEYTQNRYYIEYDNNGGTGSWTNQQTAYYNEAIQIQVNDLSKDGYRANGWNTRADGTGTHYDSGQWVTNLTSVNYGTVYLYAEWAEAASITIGFYPNGGYFLPPYEGYANVQLYGEPGESVTAPSVYREGYSFTGWNPSFYGTFPSVDTNYMATWKKSSTGQVYYHNGTQWVLCDTENIKYHNGSTFVSCSGIGTYDGLQWNKIEW